MISNDILKKAHHVHFIGIGGSGMYPLVQILHSQGFNISGSDNNETETLEAVRKLLRIGNLGIQWVLKSRKQFNSIHEVGEPVKLDRQTYREKYRARDNKAKADAKQYKPNGKFIETEGTTLLKLLQNG